MKDGFEETIKFTDWVKLLKTGLINFFIVLSIFGTLALLVYVLYDDYNNYFYKCVTINGEEVFCRSTSSSNGSVWGDTVDGERVLLSRYKKITKEEYLKLTEGEE